LAVPTGGAAELDAATDGVTVAATVAVTVGVTVGAAEVGVVGVSAVVVGMGATSFSPARSDGRSGAVGTCAAQGFHRNNAMAAITLTVPSNPTMKGARDADRDGGSWKGTDCEELATASVGSNGIAC
jgi:hypothetical protein